MKCCICGKEIKGYGNSALPLVEGICCDTCNNNVVIPTRVYLHAKHLGVWKGLDKTCLGFNGDVKVGAKVLIVAMDGEPEYSGKSGIVKHIDDAGQIHGTWGGCAIIPTQDLYFVIE